MTRGISEEGTEKRGPRQRIIIRKVVNLSLRGEIAAERARAVLYGVHIFIKSIETDELRWQTRESGSSPSPAEIAAKIRAAMRLADEQVPPPPLGGSDG
jgi:hypothetical protein